MSGPLAVIPARGGSKRIPGKNARLFNGVPMIAWSIRVAQAAGCFARIVVSTDDEAIAEVARAEGAEVPFMRAAELADDHTGTSAVVADAARRLPEHELVCCLYATAPLLAPEALRAGLARLQASPSHDYAFSLCAFGFPVQRALVMAEGGVAPLYPQYAGTRSQDLPAAYQDAGQFYWGRRQAWLAGTPVFSGASLPVILPRHRVQDIDTEEDWHRAELMQQVLWHSGELKP